VEFNDGTSGREMMNRPSIAFMLYDGDSKRNVFTEEKYKNLAETLLSEGMHVQSVLYSDAKKASVSETLAGFQAVLVWVNPIEQGNDRRILDALLLDVAARGCFVSAHPDTILKIGTKEVLYTTRDMAWGGDIRRYSDAEEFRMNFPDSIRESGTRILKRYRGNGGDGVYKVRMGNFKDALIHVTHATHPHEEKTLPINEFADELKGYFEHDGRLIDQPWCPQIINGYQEVNALYPQSHEPESRRRLTSRRYYFSEDCGLFQDLRGIMESHWVPEMQEIHSLPDSLLPLLWDADFFINDVNSKLPEKKYTLCEINTSSVSPFPESCISHVVAELKRVLQ
jgi:hypothetical protein